MTKGIWSIIAVLCMAICVACSEDEPNSPSQPDETDNDITNEDKLIAENEALMHLAEGSWIGKYYYEHDIHVSNWEKIQVYFYKKKNSVGIGTGRMYVEGSGQDGRICYSFKYSITKDMRVKCRGVQVKLDGTVLSDSIDFAFDYPYSRQLRLDAPNRAPVILGKCLKNNSEMIFSDSNGIYQRSKELLSKVWLHENGLNILDFSDFEYPVICQLVEVGSKDYNFRDNSWGRILWDYEVDENRIFFRGHYGNMEWYIKDLTPGTMILQGIYDDFEDVYYAVSPDIMPDTKVERHRADWAVGGAYK